jgi:hypothetical protein
VEEYVISEMERAAEEDLLDKIWDKIFPPERMAAMAAQKLRRKQRRNRRKRRGPDKRRLRRYAAVQNPPRPGVLVDADPTQKPGRPQRLVEPPKDGVDRAGAPVGSL